MKKATEISLNIIITAIIFAILYYLILPPISLGFYGSFAFFGLFIIAIFLLIGLILDVIKFYAIAIILYVAISIIGSILSMTFLNAGTMQQQLGSVEEIEYSEMIKQIDTAQIPIVDKDLAKKQADKKIGSDVALGSRIKLGDPAIQEVNGEILWVIPLEHTGFFKWRANHSTPGYITVSASNPNKVEFVTELDGEALKILYQESAYFFNDLKRHIRACGYKSEGLTEYTFEINDEGRPYYVVTTYKNQTVWRNGEATGVIVVDAQNGNAEKYGLNEIPEWVDVVQPKEFIERQIDNWGKLVHGAFNFANTDKIEKTDLTLTVYVDGECYYFTGMTSVGSDQSCVGFIMVNTRNKKAYMAKISGATEEAAMSSAEGLVSDFGYVATEPLPINVNGIPTYIVALKDAEGLIKSYAMVNIENYSISAKGSTISEASRAYFQTVARNNSTYVSSDEAYGYTYEGKIERISSVIEDGSTQYYMTLEGETNKIFTASYMVSPELAITRDGDSVKVSYIDEQNGTINIISFDNIAFATPVSEKQEERAKLDEGTSALDSEFNEITQVNPDLTQETWDSLSDEEKSKIMDEFLKQKE